MTSSRVWSGGAAVVAVLLVIAGWFLLISPQRSAAADLQDQTASQQAMNDQIRVKTKQLQAQFASLPERQAQLAEIKQQMPDNPALPSLIRDLSSYAGSAGVTLVSVAPGTPQAETPGGAAQAPVAPGSQPASTAGTQLMSIPTVVTASGSYSELTLYLQKLQTQMRRAFLVEGIQLATDSSGTAAKSADALQVTITGKIFQLSTTAAAVPGTATTPATTTPAN